MAKKTKTLRIKPRDLWPANASGSTIYCGGVAIQFRSGRKGRQVVVRSQRHRPKHKRIDKRG